MPTSPSPRAPLTDGVPASSRAVVQHEYGTDPAAVLAVETVATPQPGPGELLVRVEAVSLDMGTWHLMSGLPYPVRAAMGLRRPRRQNPVYAGTGLVVAVGADVADHAVGDAVLGVAPGMLAEHVVMRADQVARRAASMPAPEAAGLPVSASSALQAVDRAEVGAQDRVLVTGAAGGVGHYAVQIAAARGAEVTGVCAPHAAAFVRGLGASRIIDYTSAEITDEGGGYDVIIDCGGNRPLRVLRRAMAPKGRLVVVGGESGGRVLGGFQRLLQAMVVSPLVSQSLRPLTAADDAEHLAAVTALVEAGTLRTAIDATCPMDDVASGVARLQAGGLHGKVVITV